MAGDAKFVQITTGLTTEKGGYNMRTLFALDEEGDVWLYDFDSDKAAASEGHWVMLDLKRK